MSGPEFHEDDLYDEDDELDLERALEQQRIRRRALLVSLALNAILAVALLQLAVSA